MAEVLKNSEWKKEQLKKILKELHEGKSPEELKAKFKNLLANISPLEIPLVEQELVKEGIRPSQIAKLCDLHVLIFREAVKGKGKFDELPDGHPLKTLYLENEEIVKDAEMLNLYSATLADVLEFKSFNDILNTVKDILAKLREVGRTHYDREELIIFPYLERRGLNAVPAVLWRKHDEIRAKIKKMLMMLNDVPEDWRKFAQKIKELASELATALIDMTFRENNILYPTLQTLLSDGEWLAIKLQEKEIGYYKVEPPDGWRPNVEPIYPYQLKASITPEKMMELPSQMLQELRERGVQLRQDTYQVAGEDDIRLNVGFMTPKEIDLVLNTLPIDISFIDKNDRVKYYSKAGRIFPRTESIIGRPVQLCHPPKSVHIVNKILNAFKKGERDYAEFWIRMGERLIYIRYFAVRDENGEYIGTLEVTQDVTKIQKLEGEKRLLSWESEAEQDRIR